MRSGTRSRIIVLCALTILLIPAYSLNLGIFQTTSAATGVAFSAAVNLSNDTFQAHYPWVSTVGSNVYVAWTEEAHGIYFRASNNNGSTWTPPVDKPALKLSSVSGVTSYPVIAANGSSVYVVWAQAQSSKNETIFFAESNNGGATFSKATNVSNPLFNSITPVIAEYGNNVYVAWNENYQSSANYGGFQINYTVKSVFVTSSSDNGAQWTTPFNASVGVAAQYPEALGDEPQLAAWGNNAYLVFDAGGAPEEGVFIYTDSNQSATWNGLTTLMFNDTGALDREPWIAASGSNVYVTWNSNSEVGSNEPSSYNPYISVSNNNGVNFTAPLNLFPNGTVDWEVQDVAQGNSVYVTFRDHTPQYSKNGDVFYLQSNDAGNSWTTAAPQDLSSDNGITGWANGIAVSGNTVALGYLSNCLTGQQEPSPNSGPGDCGMFASYSSNNGATFSLESNVSNDKTAGPITDVASSTFAASGSNVYLTWQDEAKTTFQVYFSMTNGQSSQGPPPTPTIKATQVKGAVGVKVTVSGSGFEASAPITIKFGGVTVSTTPSSIVSNSTGGFSGATFLIPAAVAGSNTITATDGTNSATSKFNVVPNISEKPVSGPAGKSVTITGTGFAASSTITVTFNGVTVSIPTPTTNTVGSFTVTYKVPANSPGKYTVVAKDASGNSDSATFTIN
jgi:hypothetical protein